MELVDTMVSTVEHDVTIFKLNGLTLVEPVPCLGTDMPSLTVIIAVQNMTVVSLRSPVRQRFVIAGNNQPSFMFATLQLDSGTWSGRIPTPMLLLGRRCYFSCLFPCPAIIIRVGDEHSSGICAKTSFGLVFGNLVAIPRLQTPYPARGLVEDWTGITCNVVLFIKNNDLFSPRSATVFATAHNRINVCRVSATITTGLGKGQDGSFLRYQQCWNTVGVRFGPATLILSAAGALIRLSASQKPPQQPHVCSSCHCAANAATVFQNSRESH